MKRFVVAFLAFVLLFANAYAADQVRVGANRLHIKKINTAKFGIMNISDDGSIVTGYEQITDLKQKQKGYLYKLWAIDYSKGTESGVVFKEIMLPCVRLTNATLSKDGKYCIISAERGSKFIKADLEAKTAAVLFEHKKGKAGFRNDSGVIQTLDDGRVMANGYFYDENTRLVKRANVIVDYTKSGSAIFGASHDVTSLEKNVLDKAGTYEWFDLDKCVFVGKFNNEKDGDLDVLACFNGKNIEKLDRAQKIPQIAVGNGKVLYVTCEPTGKKGKKLEDLASQFKNLKVYVRGVKKEDKRIDVTPAKAKFSSYVFLSENTKTAVVTDMNFKGKVYTYYSAQSKNDYAVKAIGGLDKVGVSQLRLSSSGNAYVVWDGKEIIWGKI